MADSLEQLRVDLMFLAKRQKALEDDLSEWTEFMTAELLKQGIHIHKNKRSFEYFRSSLNETHKKHYEKFEALFLKIKQLFGERKRSLLKKYD